MGKPIIGNDQLVEYGIQSEQSDCRAHVCPEVRRVYIYSTSHGIDAVQSGSFEKRTAYTKKVKTAIGFLVPPAVLNCFEVIPSEDIWKIVDLCETDSSAEKGDKAVEVVKHILRNGEFPFRTKGKLISDHQMQVNGVDITVNLDVKIQVKCDFHGGDKKLGGTGNLFLQTHECNPFRIYSR